MRSRSSADQSVSLDDQQRPSHVSTVPPIDLPGQRPTRRQPRERIDSEATTGHLQGVESTETTLVPGLLSLLAAERPTLDSVLQLGDANGPALSLVTGCGPRFARAVFNQSRSPRFARPPSAVLCSIRDFPTHPRPASLCMWSAYGRAAPLRSGRSSRRYARKSRSFAAPRSAASLPLLLRSSRDARANTPGSSLRWRVRVLRLPGRYGGLRFARAASRPLCPAFARAGRSAPSPPLRSGVAARPATPGKRGKRTATDDGRAAETASTRRACGPCGNSIPQRQGLRKNRSGRVHPPRFLSLRDP